MMGETTVFSKERALVLETSTDQFSVAYFQNRECVEFVVEQAGRGRNARMFPVVEKLLKRHARPEALLVGLGPGSYTGVRLGIACIQALAMAWGVPLGGQCSLCGLGLDTGWAVGDARRGRIYFARIENGWLSAPVELVKEKKAAALIEDHLAAGEKVFTTDRSPVVAGLEMALPGADRLGESCIGRRLSTTISLEPIYLGTPFVTQPRKLKNS